MNNGIVLNVNKLRCRGAVSHLHTVFVESTTTATTTITTVVVVDSVIADSDKRKVHYNAEKLCDKTY